MKARIKQWLSRPALPYEIIIALLMAVIFSLLLDLHTARTNERELSRRLYQAVRNGYPDTPHENK